MVYFSAGVIKIHAITGEYLRRILSFLSEAESPIYKRGISTTGNAGPGLLIAYTCCNEAQCLSLLSS
jgi:hypothetical protein